MIVAGYNVKLPRQTYGHPHQNHLFVARMLHFLYGRYLKKLIITPGLPIPVAGEVNGRSVADVLLQLTCRNQLLRKNGDAEKSVSGVRKKTVPIMQSQAGKVGVATIVKTMTGTGIGTRGGAVLHVHHGDNGQRVRVWNNPLHALQMNPAMTSGLRNLAPASSWDPLLFRLPPLLQRLRALLPQCLLHNPGMMIQNLRSGHNPRPW